MRGLIAKAQEVLRLARTLEAAQAKSDRASEARMRLAPGTTRARVTSANARWMRAAEARDRAQAALRAAVENLHTEVGNG